MSNESYSESWEKQNEEYNEKRMQAEYSMLNGVLFLSFVLPAAFAIITSLPMSFFYFLIIVWVHEAGHGFFCLFGNTLLCGFSGFLNEMLFTLVPAMICFRRKEICLSGCILLMCAGMSIHNTKVYMQSAQNPYGMTSFAGALTGHYGTMTEKTHDWSVIFGELGIVSDSYGIGKFTEDFGRGIAVIFFITSVIGAFPVMYGWRPKKMMNFIGCGALISAAYFILSGSGVTEIILALVLSVPLLREFLTKVNF